jgi:methionyl-tRNA formyltransferase
MRLVFMATGDIAMPTFMQLIERGMRPLALITQPDKPVGRHQVLTPPAIKTHALAAGIPVLQPAKAGDAAVEIAAMSPDIILVMAYGQILRNDILEIPRTAIINLHASLLPKYRGAACIQAAIDAGDEQSGITSLHVVRELDAGDIILSRSITLAPDETGGSLHDRLSNLAPSLLAETLEAIASGTAPRIPQDPALVSHVSKLERDAGLLDWTRPAEALERRIRAYHPWPGTYTFANVAGKSQRLKILPYAHPIACEMKPGSIKSDAGKLIVGCGSGVLELTTVQPDGSKPMSAADYLRGRKPEYFG